MRVQGRYHCLLVLLLLLLLALALLAGCSGGASTGATSVAVATATTIRTATATPNLTCTVASPEWRLYRNLYFTICHPPQWSEHPSPGTIFTLTSPDGEEIHITEDHLTDAQLVQFCQPERSSTVATLAGLPMRYLAVEGVHRTWKFINASHYYYEIEVMDGNQSQTIQANNDAVLATFRLDDTTPGCPTSA